MLNLVESEMTSSGWIRFFPISVKAGTYIISCQHQFGQEDRHGASVSFADSERVDVGNALSGYQFGDTEFTGVPRTILADEAKRIAYIKFSMRASGTTFASIESGDIQLERNSSQTAFAPYTGNQISVTFPIEAGTVYGGTLTLNPDRTGEIVVTKVKRLLNGDLPYTSFLERTKTWRMYLTVQALKPYHGSEVKMLADSQTVYRPDYVYSNDVEGLSQNDNATQPGVWISISKERLSAYSIDGMKEYLSANPCEIVFESAESQTYQLTAEQVSGILTTLYGTNNIWANTGDTEVEYRADTKLYIDGKLAELQATILENIGG